jgi:hypothetical protein
MNWGFLSFLKDYQQRVFVGVNNSEYIRTIKKEPYDQ